jgi:hypothetical protein
MRCGQDPLWMDERATTMDRPDEDMMWPRALPGIVTVDDPVGVVPRGLSRLDCPNLPRCRYGDRQEQDCANAGETLHSNREDS